MDRYDMSLFPAGRENVIFEGYLKNYVLQWVQSSKFVILLLTLSTISMLEVGKK